MEDLKIKSYSEAKPGIVPYLSPAEVERLALLLEEMGEAQQIIGKILKHGYESCHPGRPDVSNRQELEIELGHVVAAMFLLKESEDISEDALARHAEEKEGTVGKYLHHNIDAVDKE